MNPGEPLSEGHLLDGRYRVRKVLGVGGMGRVYLSNDTRLASRPVAVKEMILGDGIAEKKAIEDFTREATVLARLAHPGIPTLIDHFAENGRHYLVMEFVAGGTLEDALTTAGGKLSEAQTLRYARQMLEVLDFLHMQNPPIVYRDIKPGNIMIDKEGRAMLIDFGIARFLPKGGKATMIGSPGYAPPEQYVGSVEPRSDLYSLAATMHHLMSGRDPALEPPFSFPPLKGIAPEVSEQTAKAVDRALSHQIDHRFASAREMLNALPLPPEDQSKSGAFSNGGSSMGSMRTVVLANPVSGHTGSPPAQPIRPSTPTPGRLTPPAPAAPRIGSGSPSLTNMPTVVLTRPASPPPTPAKMTPPAGSKPLNPSMQKAIDLGVRAKALFERGLRSKIVATMMQGGSTPKAGNSVPGSSSTAKTRELRPGAASPRQSAPVSTAERSPAPTLSRSGTVAPARPRQPAPVTPPLFPAETKGPTTGAPARLTVRGENLEFAIKFVHTTVGRSQSGQSPKPDIDLAALKRGAERVSHLHAEIVQRGTDYFVRDLGSLNGTYIAGLGRLGRDQLYKLKDRDQVVLGGAILQFRRG
ncbi:MAG: protein kinase domain-containing protein [Candidatus Binataceae bacterium]